MGTCRCGHLDGQHFDEVKACAECPCAAFRPMPDPCRCLKSHAFITPIHDGHCCFIPADSTCHQEEVAAWEAERDRMSTPLDIPSQVD
jgi:hypothetical protein